MSLSCRWCFGGFACGVDFECERSLARVQNSHWRAEREVSPNVFYAARCANRTGVASCCLLFARDTQKLLHRAALAALVWFMRVSTRCVSFRVCAHGLRFLRIDSICARTIIHCVDV